jgi:hypothetical protein
MLMPVQQNSFTHLRVLLALTARGVDSGPEGVDSGPEGVDSGPEGVDSGPEGVDSEGLEGTTYIFAYQK